MLCPSIDQKKFWENQKTLRWTTHFLTWLKKQSSVKKNIWLLAQIYFEPRFWGKMSHSLIKKGLLRKKKQRKGHRMRSWNCLKG